MRAILDLMLPPACAACGSAGALLCSACLRAARPASDPACRFVAARPGDRDRAGSLPRVGRLCLRGTDPEGARATEVRGREPPRGAAGEGSDSDAQRPPGDCRRCATGSGPRAPRAAPGARLQPGRAHRASDGFRGRAARHRSPRARAPDDEATSAGPSGATREPAGCVLGASGRQRRCRRRSSSLTTSSRRRRPWRHAHRSSGRPECARSTGSRSPGRSRRRRRAAARRPAGCRCVPRLPPPARGNRAPRAPTTRRARASGWARPS